MSLRNLITVAYRIQSTRLVGAPDWASDRFDVAAKIPNDAAPGQIGIMLQTLLAERFTLKAHHETRDEAVYALVIPSGTLGSGLRQSQTNCAPGSPAKTCGISRNGFTVSAVGVSMDTLANFLSGIVGRVVLDRTNVSGAYDFELEYAPNEVNRSNLTSIFTALQEQLRLKLEATRGPVEFLIIDHVERPTSD
jgi:uncharacterized protein (TIGR03435 family)